MIAPEPSILPEMDSTQVEEFPATLIQARLARLERAYPGAASRNVAVRWRLEGQIDAEILRAALEALTLRHEILRTVFAIRGEDVVQRVFECRAPAFSIVDITHAAIEERDGLAASIGIREARTPFDLERGPLFRATLLILEQGRAELLVTLHSIVCDGWSIGILAHEIGVLVQGLSARLNPALAELPLQYVDYALWQKEYLQSDAYAAERDYWRGALAGDALPALPTDRVRPETASGEGKILSILLPTALTDRVDEACKQAEISLFSAAASALALVLRAHADSDIVEFGTQVAGREAVELEGLIGPLANSVLLRLSAGGNPTLRGLAKSISKRIGESLVHQTAPYEAVCADAAQSPRPHAVNFILQRSFVANEDFGKFRLIDLPSHSTGALYDLSFFMIGRPEGWRISCELDPDLYDEATISRMLENWRDALDAFGRDPNTRLDNLPEALRPRMAAPVVFPCTPPQRRCWFLDQLNPGNPALNVPVSWEIRGRVSDDQVEAALRAIVARHEILRTRIVAGDLAPVQQILPSVGFDLARVDASTLSNADQRAAMESHRKAIAQAPFDLMHPPLMRAVLVRCAPGFAQLSVVFHQSVFDGWSLRVFGRELGLLLQAALENKAPNLPVLTQQYADYAQQNQSNLQSQSFEDSKQYWLKQLKGAPYFEVAPDYPRSLMRTSRCATKSASLAASTSEKLDESAKTAGVSAFALGAASVAAMLRVFTGADEIVVGTQVATRNELDQESLIGVFINNIVLRLRTGAASRFSELLNGVSDIARDALMHKDMPFDHLVELLNPPRDAARTPLIAVNLVIRRAFLETERFGDLELAAIPSPPENALYDLTFELVGRGDEWRAGIEYNADLYAPETIDDMLSLWRSVLDSAVADINTEIVQLSPPPRRHIKFAAQNGPAVAIERALRGMPYVDDAWAGSLPALANGASLYAFVTPKPDLTAPLETWPGELQQGLSAILAPLERPAGISALLRLPRTKDGAVDVAALPAPPTPARTNAAPSETHLVEIEKSLAPIWAELLGVEKVQPGDNFFELGGASLLAMRMLSAVRHRFGAAPNVGLLFSAPTLRDFAGAIAETLGDALPAASAGLDEAQIIPIQPNGGRTPIIVINNTVIYYNLARKIGGDRPVFGVQMFDAERPRSLQDRSLEDIAADFVANIRKVQPKGPYVLMGLCVSGIIAYEAARQLRRAGEDAPLVIMADSGVPNFLRKEPKWRQALHGLMSHLRAVRYHATGLARGKTTLGRIIGSYAFLRRVGFTRLLVRWGLLKESNLGEGWRNLWFQPFLEAARSRYEAAPTPESIALFLSDEVDVRFIDPQLGWRPLVQGDLLVKRAPGWHAEIFQAEGAEVISKALRPLLEAVDARRDQDQRAGEI